jgi:hypothetical protein
MTKLVAALAVCAVLTLAPAARADVPGIDNLMYC